MRLVAWNCNMKLHAKMDRLRALRPDVAVVPECARPAGQIAMPLEGAPLSSHEWSGDLENKGLGVFGFGEYVAEAVETTAAPKWVVPLRVRGPGGASFRLLAVWTQLNGALGYTKSLHAALDVHAPFVRAASTVIAGDFNSSAVFDGAGARKKEHARLVERLAELGMFSAYHAHTGEGHGAETRATFFMRRSLAEPFHIDFVFLPEAWRGAVARVEVGAGEAWREASDHCPVVVDVEGQWG